MPAGAPPEFGESALLSNLPFASGSRRRVVVKTLGLDPVRPLTASGIFGKLLNLSRTVILSAK